MLDVLMPTPVRNVDLVPGALDALCDFTDVPFRVVLAVDGGSEQDIAPIKPRVMGLPQWQIMQDHYRGFNATLEAARAEMRNEFVAIVPPEVRVADREWFGKMQMIYYKDGHAMIVDAIPDTLSTCGVPGKRDQHNLGKGIKLALMRRKVLLGMPPIPINESDAIYWIERTALTLGGSVWHSASVLFHLKEHACHASSTAAAPSELPSSTTPA